MRTIVGIQLHETIAGGKASGLVISVSKLCFASVRFDFWSRYTNVIGDPNAGLGL